MSVLTLGKLPPPPPGLISVPGRILKGPGLSSSDVLRDNVIEETAYPSLSM
jgi:hypothetical protein